MRPVLILVASLALVCTATLHAADDDYLVTEDAQSLLKASYFGIGPVFMNAKITQADAALRRIMKKDDAIKYLIPMKHYGSSILSTKLMIITCYLL